MPMTDFANPTMLRKERVVITGNIILSDHIDRILAIFIENRDNPNLVKLITSLFSFPELISIFFMGSI